MNETTLKQYEIVATETITVHADTEETALEHAKRIHGNSDAEFDIQAVTPVESITGGSVRVRFHPQEWVQDHAVEATPLGEQTFTVPVEDATDGNGQLVVDDSRDSDALKNHDRAPQWIRDWTGPFYVTLER